MGMLKRILRQTSHKLLAKIGAQRSSHRLILNSATCSAGGQLTSAHAAVKSRASRRIKRHGKKLAGSKSALSEALLLAAKNHLPPVQFHHVHGPNVQLSPNKFVARRTQSFCQALVFSNRVILPNERVYIKVLEIAKGWSGTIRFGFTSVDPATLRYQMPKHACPDMTNAGHTWARALADEVVRRNSVIHFSYNTDGYIHYGINNQDCGIFNANVKTSQHLWFIVDIYGLTATVELIDPRIHNNSTSELSFSRLDDELRNDMSGNRTMYKSTGPMDELVGTAFGVRSKKKKKKSATGRKSSRQSANLLYGQWSPENLMMAAHQAPMLPNLSSIILPPSQQNIYSPMPSVADVRALERTPAASSLRNDTHDYYQIMTSRHANNGATGGDVHSNSQSRLQMANRSYDNFVAIESSTTNNISARSRFEQNEDEEICQQLDSFQISDNNATQQQSTINFPRPTSSTPVAATRKRQPNNLVQTNSKRTPPEASKDYQSKIPQSRASGSSSKPLTATAATSKSSSGSSGVSKSRARGSSNGPKAVQTSRDINNNSPPSKDCPICFERPINCVLYQCGHMCTCYECGVKQWKTQSRTCPICRTVIKDVIKTYMS